MQHDAAFFALHNLSCPFDVMRFILVYRGPLSATQGKRGKRKSERIEIRKQINPQMKRLWQVSQPLTQLQWDARVPGPNLHTMAVGASPLYEFYDRPPQYPPEKGFVDLTEPIERFGRRFRPLVRASLNLTCSLEILFLRQEDPGALIKHGGDIDNRIKTFIDALEMPQSEPEGDESEEMNYPLLENDSLVKGVEIDTERLLLPEQEFPNQVHLVCEVIVHVERVGPWNVCLL